MQSPNAGQFYPLGLFPHGDLGPLTFYTSRNRRIVRFPRSPPKSPPTYSQQRQRLAWRAAAQMWSALPDVEREWWRLVAAKNHLRITHYNLFIAYMTTPNPTWLDTLVAKL